MAGAGYALEQALAYYRAPALLAMAAQRPLPDDVIELLRLAAGDAAQAAASAEASGESAERVAEAAVFFVQQVMFAAGDDPHRVLGVNPDAPPARLREHYRWLIRWLHPDRNADEWDNVYTDRVTRAWQQLRRSGALAGEGEGSAGEAESDAAGPRFDAAQEAEWSALARQSPAVVLAAARRARLAREVEATPILSASTARRLPGFVLGGLALAAVSLVALLWYAEQRPARPALAGPAPTARDLAGPAMSPPARPAALPVADLSAPSGPAAAAMEEVSALEPATEALSVTRQASDDDALARLAAGNPPAAAAGVLPEVAPRNAPVAAAPFVAAPAAAPAAAPVGDYATSTATALTAAPAADASARTLAAAPAADANAQMLTAAPAPAPPPIPATATIDEATAHALLARFRSAYAAGDINALMHLFTRDARNNRGGRDAIAYDYQSLFTESRERRLELQPTGWITGDTGTVVLADYQAWVKESRLLPGTTTEGAIRFTLRREDGVPKISQVIHD